MFWANSSAVNMPLSPRIRRTEHGFGGPSYCVTAKIYHCCVVAHYAGSTMIISGVPQTFAENCIFKSYDEKERS